MRIIGGTSRGRRLSGPGALKIRPTADNVREALFNILADRVTDARVLDLFAGTGGVGIEALSRGAEHVTFVESSAAVARLLQANLKSSGFEEQAELRLMPVSRFLKHAGVAPYDIIFLDPPYGTRDTEKVLPSLGADVMIRPNGVVIVEHFHKSPLVDQFGDLVLMKTYRYGDSCLSVYAPAPREVQA